MLDEHQERAWVGTSYQDYQWYNQEERKGMSHKDNVFYHGSFYMSIGELESYHRRKEEDE